MTVHTVNPGHRVGSPDRGHWRPSPPPTSVVVHGRFAAPGPEVLRRVIDGLQRLGPEPVRRVPGSAGSVLG